MLFRLSFLVGWGGHSIYRVRHRNFKRRNEDEEYCLF